MARCGPGPWGFCLGSRLSLLTMGVTASTPLASITVSTLKTLGLSLDFLLHVAN